VGGRFILKTGSLLDEEVTMELTSRQREIFNFIRGFIKERGYPPSVREIGEHFNIYPRAAFDHLKALE
jgi:repressor LexA